MPEYQKPNPSDTGLCEHGNFLPCAICEEAQKSLQSIENGTELGDEAIESAKNELMELGIESTKENIETVVELKNTPQFPEGCNDILNSLDNPQDLKEIMKKRGISAIVHAEGKSVWDHVRRSIELVNDSDIPDREKRIRALVMLYHDLGKTEVWDNEKNSERTKKNLEKGELHQAMIGHAEAGLNKIQERLSANGISQDDLEIITTVIKNHMQTSIADQDPKKTKVLIESFGKDDEERKKTVELLAFVLRTDGNATEHIQLSDGELYYSKNEKKLELDFGVIWEKYEQGKTIIAQEEAEKQSKQAEADRQTEVLGMKLSDYIKQRGVKSGPDMGKAMIRIKNIITDNESKSVNEIKEIIDGIHL